jgi:alcohol dehydrogenase (cytochrome c)
LLGQVNVLIANGDNNRTNANLYEFRLAPANVRSDSFGKLGSFPADGEIYAQPLYSPRTRLFYISTWQDYYMNLAKMPAEYTAGQRYTGGAPRSPVPTLERGPINTLTAENGSGAVVAMDPNTGEKKWQFQMTDVTGSGIMATASDIVFSGGREGYFYALDGRNGTMLWKAALGG